MPLLGEEENTNNTEAVVPPTGGIDQGQQAILNALQSRQPANPINISDFKVENPAMGALHETDYFPGINTPIQTGNYSGSIVGNNPIYTPTNYVPFGLLDARDAAIHKAALQKQMEANDFMKRHQNPETKHVAVQEELTKGYQDFLGSSISRAKKTYGKNWAAALNQDPDFNRANQNFQDRAKFHDAIVDHAAKLDLLDKDPNMVILPDTKKASADLLSGASYHGADPFSQEGQEIGKKFLGAKGMVDLDVGINTLVSKMIPNINEEQLGALGREGTERILTDVKTKQFSPEAQEKMAQDFSMQTGWPKPMVLEHIKAIQDKQIELKRHMWDAYHSPHEGKEEDYSSATPQINSSVNQTVMPDSKDKNVKNFAHTTPVHMEDVFNTTAKDQAKELTFTLTDKVVDLEGKKLNDESGHVKGQVQQVGSFAYYPNQKRFLTPTEAEGLDKLGELHGNKSIDWRPGAILNITPKTDDKGKVAKSQSAIIPIDDVKGKFGKSFDENVITKVQESAKAKNNYQAPTESGKMITVTVNGRTGQIPEKSWDAFKKKNPSASK